MNQPNNPYAPPRSDSGNLPSGNDFPPPEKHRRVCLVLLILLTAICAFALINGIQDLMQGHLFTQVWAANLALSMFAFGGATFYLLRRDKQFWPFAAAGTVSHFALSFIRQYAFNALDLNVTGIEGYVFGYSVFFIGFWILFRSLYNKYVRMETRTSP